MSMQDFLIQQVSSMIQNHSDQQQHTGFDPSALLGELQQMGGQGGLNLQQVQSLIQNHADQQQQTGFNPSGLLSQVQGLFAKHQGGDQSQYGNVKSSDDDPYGDPGDAAAGQFKNVKSSDDDPYGDPGAKS